MIPAGPEFILAQNAKERLLPAVNDLSGAFALAKEMRAMNARGDELGLSGM
jgi:hypothetical protein